MVSWVDFAGKDGGDLRGKTVVSLRVVMHWLLLHILLRVRSESVVVEKWWRTRGLNQSLVHLCPGVGIIHWLEYILG